MNGVAGSHDSEIAFLHTAAYWPMDVSTDASCNASTLRPVPRKLSAGAMPCSARTSTSAAILYGAYMRSLSGGRIVAMTRSLDSLCPRRTFACPEMTFPARC